MVWSIWSNLKRRLKKLEKQIVDSDTDYFSFLILFSLSYLGYDCLKKSYFIEQIIVTFGIFISFK